MCMGRCAQLLSGRSVWVRNCLNLIYRIGYFFINLIRWPQRSAPWPVLAAALSPEIVLNNPNPHIGYHFCQFYNVATTLGPLACTSRSALPRFNQS